MKFFFFLNVISKIYLDIFKRCGGVYREADEEDVCLRIGQRPQSVVVLLSGSIPQSERHRAVLNHYGRLVVIENRWYILGWKGARSVANEHAGLADCPVAAHDALDVLHIIINQDYKEAIFNWLIN